MAILPTGNGEAAGSLSYDIRFSARLRRWEWRDPMQAPTKEWWWCYGMGRMDGKTSSASFDIIIRVGRRVDAY